MREPNILLDAILDEAGMSHGGLAARVNRLGDRDSLSTVRLLSRGVGHVIEQGLAWFCSTGWPPLLVW
jgi:hypothetical protein